MPFNVDTTTSYETQEDFTASDIYTRKADGTEPQRESGTDADEVDPRKLMQDPTVDELRWLARTSFGGALVEKPIKDAFKYGFDLTDEDGNNDRAETVLDDTDWQEHYVQAQIKARRDGFALVMAVLEDNASVGSDPLDDDVEVSEFIRLQVLSLDDLAKFEGNGSVPSGRISRAMPDDLEDRVNDGDLEIRKTGIVVDMDPDSNRYKKPVGYIVGNDKARDPDEIQFVHHNRIFHHLVWNPWVDHDLDTDSLGELEGDSILTSSYHLLRGLKKGNWSIMQTLFRYAAKLYHVELPEDADSDDWDQANNNMTNLNAMSELITPAGYEIDDFGTDGQLEPQEYFDVIFDQVCASNEMTKSVLFGTQTGTVSGSETDIKNYFNKVERMRTGRIHRDMEEFVTNYRLAVDGRTEGEYEANFEVEWGPLFKMTDLDRAEALTRQMQTLSSAINDFVMTPQEARGILQEEWAEANIDWTEEFSEEEKEFLRTLNIAQMGTEAALPEDGNPRVGQNGGGREQGQTSDPDNPSTDALNSLSDRDVDRIAQRVVELMS